MSDDKKETNEQELTEGQLENVAGGITHTSVDAGITASDDWETPVAIKKSK